MPSKPNAQIILDSAAPGSGARITTMLVRMHRFVLAEFNTHRAFCLAGDSLLEFDLPKGTTKGTRRIFQMRIDEFVDKWHNGAAPRPNNGGRGTNRQPVRKRLEEMMLRCLNEETGEYQHTRVTNAFISGEKDVYEVTTVAGSKITASADHLFFTDSGWQKLKDLQVGLSKLAGKRQEEKWSSPPRIIRGKNIAQWNREVKSEVFGRQGGRCAYCPASCTDIHHVIPIHEDETKAFDITNVVGICEPCHKAQHKVQGWQAGNPLIVRFETVKSVEYIGRQQTYDIEVAGDFHNFVANGLVVHNSRNSASSRAIPIRKRIHDVLHDLAWPISWGSNKPGMQAGAELTGRRLKACKLVWKLASLSAVASAWALSRLGLHKQVANRLLEPFLWHDVCVTATEWENFFSQRCHPDAQPEMRAAANAMFHALNESIPIERTKHLPFDDTNDDWGPCVSIGRAAQTSFKNPDGTTDVLKDVERYYRLKSAMPPHKSPFEHAAEATPGQHANFFGWKQYRHIIFGEGN